MRKNSLQKLMATITGYPRYCPNIEWSHELWTFNMFRAYEWLFGRRHGVRLEAQTISENVNGKRVVTHRFYTVEALIVHCETVVRNFFRGFEFGFEWVEIPQFQYVTIGGLPNEPIKLPSIVFAIAYDTIGAGGTSAPATSITYSHTATGSDRGIIIDVIIGDVNGGAGNTTATYAGVSSSETQNIPSTGGRRLFMFDQTTIASGANNVVVSFGNSLFADANSLTYSGVDQTNMEDTSTKTSGGTPLTVSVTTTADNCWLSGLGSILGTGAATAGTGTTSRGTAGAMRLGDSNGAKTPAGSHSMGWTGTGTIQGFMIAIKPSVAVGPTNLKSLDTNVKANIKSYNTNVLANIKSINTNA